jgi:NAD+ kinase
MRIGIHGRDFQTKSTRFIENVLDQLKQRKAEIWLSSKFVKQIKSPLLNEMKYKVFEQGDSLRNLDFFFSLGGDGTMLESVTYIGKAEVPILGINTGRLGFLAITSRDEIDRALEAIFSGNYKVESRTMLKLVSSSKLFEPQNFALNDFTIMKKDTSSMITVHVFVDGELLNSYWSDGPIVISDKSEITFEIEGRSKKYLVSLDSRFETIDDSVSLKIKKERFNAKLVQLPGHHYFNTLRQKLNWGLDIRN